MTLRVVRSVRYGPYKVALQNFFFYKSIHVKMYVVCVLEFSKNRYAEDIALDNLQTFINMICGNFDNSAQFEQITASGVDGYPLAKHTNTMCNNKIENLPTGFNGMFVLEESYYTIQDSQRSEPRLFLFTETVDGILLTSYDLPQSIDKATLNYSTMPVLSYEILQPSQKFTPALFTENDGVWHGGSESMFTPTLKFTLTESFSQEKLVVSEVMESNGKRTFGFEPPIEYRRI